MSKYDDKLYFKERYNNIETALKTDSELLRVSSSVKDKAIYCHEFKVSKESLNSLKLNNNYLIGTGLDAKLFEPFN